MDSKITKTRLKTFFFYDFIKVVAVAVVLCFSALVIFNWVGEKPTQAQIFYVMCDPDVIIGSEGVLIPAETAQKGCENGGFSYDILEVSTSNLNVGSYSASYMLRTSIELGDDDIFITQEELGKEYLEKYAATDIVEFVKMAKQYCIDNNFYTIDGTINESAIRNYFLNVHKKDNRFRSNKNKEKGVALEIQRIKAIWDNANLLEKVFDEHSEIFSDKLSSFTWGDHVITGKFAIELSKLTGGSSVLANAFTRAITSEGSDEITYTTEGLYLLVANNQDINGDLDYESLAYIRTIFEKYSNFIQE